ncbi:MAG: aldehyde dehydrogenase family protein [Myxococcota bacterium]|nr:aldehyde dehydrogenase family protein [Myxococcota bacterium]
MKFPTPPNPMPKTPFEEIDKALNRLEKGKKEWPNVTPEGREVLIRECMTDLEVAAEEWVMTNLRGKGVHNGEPDEGAEWIGGFMPVMRNLRMLAHAMKHKGQPPLLKKYQDENGRWRVKVFPTDIKDKLLYGGFDAEVWLQDGALPTQGKIYREKSESKIALILGAGNSGSIGPMDCLYKLFVENEVCILKMNPVNDYLGLFVARAFRALIEGNFLTVVYGDVEEGQYLCNHEKVDTIHITGSHHTHDAIVWGKPRQSEPILKKPITSELGCIDPIIVVPGNWTPHQIDYQARHIVSMVTHNTGYNCNSGNILLLADGWDKKDALLSRIQKHMRQKAPKKAYYPGTQERYQGYLDRYPEAIICSDQQEGTIPWTIFNEVPAKPGEHAFKVEPFCGILCVSKIDATSASDYLEKVVPFCNDHIWGTLSCNLLIDDATAKSQAPSLEKAIRDLRYGTVAVNAWNGVSYGMCTTTWGAYPGHTLEDIESGIGTVHNTYLLDHPLKSVMRGPFIFKPTPAWFYDHKNLIGIGKRLVAFEHKPSWLNLIAVVSQALRG